MPDVVTIQDIGMHGALEQLSLECLGNGRFSSTGEPGQPKDRSAMTASQCALAGGNFSLGPKNILALGSFPVGINTAENRAATADPSVVHDNKSAEIRDAIMIVDNEWAPGLNCQSANLVSL